jgi:alkanesulfonate monooxygenase SsuD/methylene tetrahydromethanopterin reductase-like flavin-dependent oxidoreductase (luciferase family)
MEIGIGLPSTISAVTGADVLTWARDADEAGFSTLGTLDRVVYGNHETIPTLAAAAAVTSHIRLTTAILISPFRGNGTLLAKQLATIDSFAKGRLNVGIAVGGRDDDYTATGSDFHSRGATFDDQLTEMHEVWAGESRGTAGAVGPAPQRPGGVPLLIGGQSPAAYRRMVSHGAGWLAGGGGPSMFAQTVEPIRKAWKDGGRSGEPRLVALGYYALGQDATALAEGYLRDYYAFAGEYVDMVVSGAATSEAGVSEQIKGFADAGCDELILFPCSPDPDQLKRLADVTLG